MLSPVDERERRNLSLGESGLDPAGDVDGLVTHSDRNLSPCKDRSQCQQHKAEKGSENVKVDLSAEDEDIEKLEAFAEELVAKAN